MRTTIDLPDNLLHEATVRAAQEGVKLKDLIARYIADGLLAASLSNGAAPRRRSEFPVIHMGPGPAMPALTNADIEQILLDEDINSLRVEPD